MPDLPKARLLGDREIPGQVGVAARRKRPGRELAS